MYLALQAQLRLCGAWDLALRALWLLSASSLSGLRLDVWIGVAMGGFMATRLNTDLLLNSETTITKQMVSGSSSGY